MTTSTEIQAVIQQLYKLPMERILSIGITGSGKSYQWLQIARRLKPYGVKFRVIDTDNDIDYMLHTQFPDLLPENGGNVYVFPAFDWPEYEKSVKWVLQRGLSEEYTKTMDKHLLSAYKTPLKAIDWVVLDKSNNAWSQVQTHFVTSVFGEDMGEYFLSIRKKLYESGDIGKSGKKATSVSLEALDGWKDWSVINKLYDDWINPIVYRIRCNVYATADVESLGSQEKDPEVLNVFGSLKLKPAGNKKIGGQMHTILLFMPGTNHWSVKTMKDRSGRKYFDGKQELTDIYNQYLFRMGNWPLIMNEE